MTSKEIWILVYEQFREKHGRSPTSKEADDAYADYCAGIEARQEDR